MKLLINAESMLAMITDTGFIRNCSLGAPALNDRGMAASVLVHKHVLDQPC